MELSGSFDMVTKALMANCYRGGSSDGDIRSDDDVKANLRHLCDEAVDFLRACLLPESEPTPSTMGGWSPMAPDRVDLAIRILKELGIPPPAR